MRVSSNLQSQGSLRALKGPSVTGHQELRSAHVRDNAHNDHSTSQASSSQAEGLGKCRWATDAQKTAHAGRRPVQIKVSPELDLAGAPMESPRKAKEETAG